MMYRVLHVEAYRRWLLKEDATLEDMLSYITGTEETEAMRKGTAFHGALETACTGDKWERVRSGEYTFIFSGDFEIKLAPIREWRQCKNYMVDGKPIVITGKVDALFGKRIDDHKTTREFDAEGYAEGYQWRLYLDIFNADLFRWNVLNVKKSHRLNMRFMH